MGLDCTFMVVPTDDGGALANTFKHEFLEEHSLEDHPSEEIYVLPGIKDRDYKEHKHLLHYYQRAVMETYGDNILESAGPTDDLMNDEDPLVRGVYQIYKDFKRINPNLDVCSIIPIDLSGTFGFVIFPNDMYF